MLVGVDPLLHRIESLPEHGSYTATFVLSDGAECSIVMRATERNGGVPEANLIPGWQISSESFQAVVAAIVAVHEARNAVGTERTILLDIPGGWDVGLGNVIVAVAGTPECVAHGEMEAGPGQVFRCPECGAAAILQSPGA
jgi:hypothetical protein